MNSRTPPRAGLKSAAFWPNLAILAYSLPNSCESDRFGRPEIHRHFYYPRLVGRFPGFRRSRLSTPIHRCFEFPPRPDIILSTRVRSVAGSIGGCFSANKLYHGFAYSKPMATRFVPTHVRSAITVIETDHERTTTERDAFANFLHRISDLDVSAVDLQPNHAHQAST